MQRPGLIEGLRGRRGYEDLFAGWGTEKDLETFVCDSDIKTSTQPDDVFYEGQH